MRTTILSPNQTYSARLSDDPAGVRVAIRRQDGRINLQVWSEVIDAPFHVLADRMVDVLVEMEAVA